MNVLMLGGAGSLLDPVIARSLGREGAHVVRGESRTDPALPSRFYHERLLHPPLEDRGAFQAFMLAHAHRHRDQICFPGSDKALLALDGIRPELDGLMPIAAPPRDAVRAALDKSATLEVAAGLDDAIGAPLTLRPRRGEPVAAQWNGRYPAIVKPRTGTQTEGIRIAHDARELEAAYAATAAGYKDPLVQEAVEFRIERKFTLYYLFDHEGRLKSWYGQQILTERHSIMRAGTEEKVAGGVALFWQSAFDADLLRRGQRLMEALNWRGLGFIECAFDERDGIPYLFEINPRPGGTQALSLREGVNLVHDACLVARKEKPPERLTYRTGVRAKRDPFTLFKTRDPAMIRLILDPRPWPSTPPWHDPAPMLAMAVRAFSSKITSA